MKILKVFITTIALLHVSVFAETNSQPEKTTSDKSQENTTNPSGVSQNPYTGLPGYTDTATPTQGSVVLSLPTTAIKYGITDRWSVGSNVGSLLLIPFANTILVYLDTRYRYYDDGALTMAGSAYLGGASASAISAYFGLFSHNIQYVLNQRHVFDLNTSFGDIKLKDKSDKKQTVEYNLFSGFVMGRYAFFLTPRFAMALAGEIGNSRLTGHLGDSWDLDDYVDGEGFDINANYFAFEMEFVRTDSSRLSFGVGKLNVKSKYLTKSVLLPELDITLAF
jgi:hypothetical protein